MVKDLRGFKQQVEGKIAEILREEYGQSIDPLIPIKYYLDFKSDQILVELRDALERIEKGTYGRCALCSRPIPEHILESSPATIFCGSCRS
jgi:hypothetical protein